MAERDSASRTPPRKLRHRADRWERELASYLQAKALPAGTSAWLIACARLAARGHAHSQRMVWAALTQLDTGEGNALSGIFLRPLGKASQGKVTQATAATATSYGDSEAVAMAGLSPRAPARSNPPRDARAHAGAPPQESYIGSQPEVVGGSQQKKAEKNQLYDAPRPIYQLVEDEPFVGKAIGLDKPQKLFRQRTLTSREKYRLERAALDSEDLRAWMRVWTVSDLAAGHVLGLSPRGVRWLLERKSWPLSNKLSNRLKGVMDLHFDDISNRTAPPSKSRRGSIRTVPGEAYVAQANCYGLWPSELRYERYPSKLMLRAWEIMERTVKNKLSSNEKWELEQLFYRLPIDLQKPN